MNGTLLVRIWDPDLGGNGLPNDSVGKVTITGTFASGQLRILAAGTGDSWSDSNTIQLLNPGLLHLGLNSDDGIVVTDATLCARTRLSAYTAGDIRGTIELGQVQRVQCGADPFNPVGTISGDFTSLAVGNAFGMDENPTGRDPDFDGDGNVNQDDVQALVNTIGGGGCPRGDDRPTRSVVARRRRPAATPE